MNCATWAPSYLQNQQSRSVVKIYLPNCGECTGTLLAQKDVQTNDFKYYVLTAKHCINKAGPGLYTEEDYKNTSFIFNYQRSGCNTYFPGEFDAITANQTKGERYYIKGARLIDYRFCSFRQTC